MEWVTCALCDSDSIELLMTSIDSKMSTHSSFQLVRCRHCGLIYLNPRPTATEMQYFQDYYETKYGDHVTDWANVRENRKADQYYQNRMRFLLDHLPRDFNGRLLLDVGCGDGVWLQLMRSLGWQTTGVEISLQGARFAREHYDLDVKVGPLVEQRFPTDHFDVVTFWHSLEHMHTPKTALREAHRILRRGGVVVVQVPNINTVLFRIFGRYYSMRNLSIEMRHYF